MDMRYLDKLERELRKRDKTPVQPVQGITGRELEAALKRGREYHAIALNLSAQQLVSRLKTFFHNAIRLRYLNKRHTSTNLSSPGCQ